MVVNSLLDGKVLKDALFNVVETEVIRVERVGDPRDISA